MSAPIAERIAAEQGRDEAAARDAINTFVAEREAVLYAEIAQLLRTAGIVAGRRWIDSALHAAGFGFMRRNAYFEREYVRRNPDRPHALEPGQ